MSITQFQREFPQLAKLRDPKGYVSLVEAIGKGNYGFVYKGRMLQKNNELAAIKVVYLKEEEIAETLLEGQILSKCDHPNIIQYHGSFLKGLDFWMCMEYCGAGSIDTIYRALQKPMPDEAVACIIYETLLGLDYLHTNMGIIHRDIKAGNLLLTMDGQLKLADFGVSAVLDSVGGKASSFVGTPYWMAPEVIYCDYNRNSDASFYTDKVDIWSLGITVIEIIEKSPPLADLHPMQALSIIKEGNISFSDPNSISKLVAGFVQSLLIKDPLQRPSARKTLALEFMRFAGRLSRQKILSMLARRSLELKEQRKMESHIEEDMGKVIFDPNLGTKRGDDVNKEVVTGRLTDKQVQEYVSMHPILAKQQPVIDNQFKKDMKLFSPVPISAHPGIHTATFLDKTYVLFGTDQGLFFINLAIPGVATPTAIISGIRFRQIQILEEYNILIALSGKNDQVRQYHLRSLRKLILFLEGNDLPLVMKTNTYVPINSVPLGKSMQSEYDIYNKKVANNPTAIVTEWSKDFVKLNETKDTKSFSIHKTQETSYLSIQGLNITLFRWATSPYDKFMKIKSFWVPEIPKFAILTDDGAAATDLFFGYSAELNRVSIFDSTVTELETHSEMKSNSLFGKSGKWENIIQIPVTYKESDHSNKRNRKISKIIGVESKKVLEKRDRYFLGTFDRMTKVIDRDANPMVGSGAGGWEEGVKWSQAPVCQFLRPLEYVINVGKNVLEVVTWKSAVLRQRLVVDKAWTLKVMNGTENETLVSIDQKGISILYWMREPDVVYIPARKDSGVHMANLDTLKE